MLVKTVICFQTILIFYVCPSFGQISREEVDFLVKYTLFQDAIGACSNKNTEPEFQKFLKFRFEIDTLGSTGFFDFLFLRISSNYKIPEHVNVDDGPVLIGNCKGWIVAISHGNRKVFKLKGFVENDFSGFISRLRSLGYPKTISLRGFINSYQVEDLDLVCLYRSYASKNANKEKYPCLLSCSEVIYIE